MFLIWLWSIPAQASLNEKINFTLTPTLWRLTLNRGEIWKSQLKITNQNSYPLSIRASITPLENKINSGESILVPTFDQTKNNLEWISVSKKLITISPKQTAFLPIEILIPKTNRAQDYAAAILVGHEPLDPKQNSNMAVSSYLSTFVLVSMPEDKQKPTIINNKSSETKINFWLDLFPPLKLVLIGVGIIIITGLGLICYHFRKKMAVDNL